MADSKEEEKRSLEEALQREIVQCYVLEGHYPDSLSYLEEQYGFSYDKEHFFCGLPAAWSKHYAGCDSN